MSLSPGPARGAKLVHRIYAAARPSEPNFLECKIQFYRYQCHDGAYSGILFRLITNHETSLRHHIRTGILCTYVSNSLKSTRRLYMIVMRNWVLGYLS